MTFTVGTQFLLSLAIVFSATAAEKIEKPSGTVKSTSDLIQTLRARVRKLNFNWDNSLFVETGWETKGHSVDGYPLVYWTCGDRDKTQNASLILSAVHGDEVTPVYFGFRLVEYIKARPELCQDRFIVVAPFVNPDGFFRYSRGTRTNFNKVDVNRNFDTPDWAVNAQKIWKEKYASQRRYFPGDKAASEPETVFQQWLISEFKPVKILSIHAPLNILDFDGPLNDSARNFFTAAYLSSIDDLKVTLTKATPELRFYAYGQFPGSLGNYAGKQRGIPTITTELPSTDANRAGLYFGTLEKSTRLFIEHEIKESPHGQRITVHK